MSLLAIASAAAKPAASPTAMQLALIRLDECATWSAEIGRPAISRFSQNIRVAADAPGLVSVTYELDGIHKLLKIKF